MDSFKIKIAEELLYTGNSLPEDLQVAVLEYVLTSKKVITYTDHRQRETDPQFYYFEPLNGRRLRLAKMLLPRLTISHQGKTSFIRGMEKKHGLI